MSSAFGDVSTDDVVKFAAEFPLAWITPVADPAASLLMPLLIETDPAGQPVSVVGHLPRRAPATELLQQDGRAVFLFLGPNAYIPPAWVSKPGWVPTWNFLSLKILSDQAEIEDSLTRPAVEALVRHMESRQGSDWSVDDIGERYDTLLNQIIGFRSNITSAQPRFKLGQDETPAVHEEIKQALEPHPMAQWMK